MPGEVARAVITAPTAEINLTDYTPAEPLFWPLAYRTYELVTRYAAKPHVAVEDLQVGGTNTSEMNSNDSGMIVSRRRAARRIAF
jgi:hypothetical protein